MRGLLRVYDADCLCFVTLARRVAHCTHRCSVWAARGRAGRMPLPALTARPDLRLLVRHLPLLRAPAAGWGAALGRALLLLLLLLPVRQAVGVDRTAQVALHRSSGARGLRARAAAGLRRAVPPVADVAEHRPVSISLRSTSTLLVERRLRGSWQPAAGDAANSRRRERTVRGQALVRLAAHAACERLFAVVLLAQGRHARASAPAASQRTPVAQLGPRRQSSNRADRSRFDRPHSAAIQRPRANAVCTPAAGRRRPGSQGYIRRSSGRAGV